jgi:dGTPase
LSDDIAYIAHDFDDALRSGILTISSLAENKEQFNFIDFSYIANLDKSIARNYFSRSIMNYLILDLLNETENTLSNNSQIRSIEDVIINTNFLVKFSPPVLDKVKFLKNFLFEFFYTSDFVYKNRTQAEKILVSIIKLLNNDISMLPSKWKEKLQYDTDKQQIIVDYVCGMTDQYAINFYKKYVT